MSKKPSYNEDRYFTSQSAERRKNLRDKLDKVAKQLEEKTAIATTLATDDASLVDRIHALGFDGDSVRVFDLLPLIHVSWADGKVQRKERATILAVLEKRGIEPGSEASTLVETLLEMPPSEAFMKASMELLRDLLSAKGQTAGDLVDLCVSVADASGGLLGIGNRIAEEERDLIRGIAETLGNNAQEQFKKRLG